MAKKQESLTNKFNSWADQASLTRGSTSEERSPVSQASEQRESYEVALSLMERITSRAAQHGMTKSEVVGYLLTWALDQLDQGALHLPPDGRGRALSAANKE
jgi:hypothetical protein